jgi:hypothetical protein
VLLVAVLEFAHDSFGEQRNNSIGTKFGGFLNNGIEEFALRQGLPQRDSAGWGRSHDPPAHGEFQFVALQLRHFTIENVPFSIQDLNPLADSHPQNVQGVVRFASL